VDQHLHSASRLASGVRSLPGLASPFAATQAAWRFFANGRVCLPDLAAPLVDAGRAAVAASAAGYALLVHDQSHLHYYTHASKTDQARLSHRKDYGYELTTALLVDAASGHPLAPLEVRLRTADAVYSTREPAPARDAFWLDEVRATMRSVADLGLARPLVHVIDSEADSVAHLRDWHADGRLFLVRTDGRRRARYGGRECLLTAVAEDLRRRGAFRHRREVLYHGAAAEQFIAEAEVVLDRPGQRQRRRGRGRRARVPGPPLPLRLVVSEVRDAGGRVLAVWLLLTNVPAEVPAATVALWYYWRWRVESFFKLLKSAGQEVESWQQETGEAVAKRLLVAAMACVVTWGVARAEGPDADAARALLVRLSGRQMKRGVKWTGPALLAGLWVLLAFEEEVQRTGLDELRRVMAAVLPPPRAVKDDRGSG
jgi:hypothetical protein